jgi:very-long-chain (3R)-3-hydroxyacyl-CoA dehydratase
MTAHAAPLFLSRAGAFQVASVLEVLHAAFRLTKSPVSAALMQWVGRTHVLMAVTHAIPELQSTPAAGVLFMAWALTEVIRYPTYALSLSCPRWLNWLRYTIFIPLYPIGALSEMKLMYDGIPTMRANQMYSITLPNALNFGFDYTTFVTMLLVAYPFLFYSLYAYMFIQRKKKLALIQTRKED